MSSEYTNIVLSEEFQNNSLLIKTSEANTSIYQLKTPFQVTYISCSGDKDQDLLNITTLSSHTSLHYSQKLSDHHRQYHSGNLHIHDYFELLVVLEGTVTQMIEHKAYLYTPGTCCLINRSLYHLEDYSGAARVMFIGFSVDFIQELFLSCEHADFPVEKEILNSDFYRFIMNDLRHPGPKAYLDFLPAMGNHTCLRMLHSINSQIMEVMLHPGFGATHQIKGLFSALIHNLSSPAYYHCTEVLLEHNSDALIFARASHLIEERDGRISREELARQLNYSGDYVNRIVKKFTGLCLFDYSMNFCMKKAADQLIHSSKSISEIASELHFSNRTYFYRLFRDTYGMTPKEYRATKKESSQSTD